MKRPIYMTLASVLTVFALVSLMLALSSFTTIDNHYQSSAGPALNCKAMTTVGINADTTYLLPDSLVNGRDFGVTLQVRRMRTDFFVASDTIASASIRIGCSDVGRTIMVEVIATADGMSTSCMVEVIVQNKLPIQIENTLPDITISCEDYRALSSNLDNFGKYQTDIAQVRNLSIGDFEFTDGLVSRVCGNLRIRTEIFDSTKCNFGKILRKFIIKDVTTPNDSLVETQEILIINMNPFNEYDIIIPNDTLLMGCFKPPFARNLGGLPMFLNLDKCAMPVSNFTDMVFNDPNSGCPIIMRTWKVMDMCTFKNDKSMGYWEFVQNIQTMDTIAPRLSLCKDTVMVNTNGACTVPVNLAIDAVDNCTLYKDLKFSYIVMLGEEVIKNGNTNQFSAELPQGVYVVKWEVDDRCGNIATCSMTLTAKEGKKPTPVYLPGIVASLPVGCDVYLNASTFNKASYDNCTAPQDLKYSFSPDITDDTLVLNCTDLGIDTILLYVTDLAGNQSFATVFINLQDPNKHCPVMAPIAITGQIMTDDEMYVPEVNILLEGAEQQRTAMTDDFGRFELLDLVRHSDYELKASKNVAFKAGINVLDVIAMQKHILGIKKLENGHRLIAADVNGSEHVDVQDIVELRKIILGVKNPEANIPSWRFLPNTNKTSSTDPWPIVDLAFYENLENDTHIEFKAIKIGDVDGSISKTLSGRSSGIALLQTKDQVFDAGDIVNVELSLAELNALQGIQIALGFNQSALKLNRVSSKYDISKEDYVISGDGLKILKDYKKVINIADDSPFVTLEFTAQKNGNLLSNLFLDDAAFDAVAQGGAEDVKLLALDIISEKQAVMVVRQNAPNPFTDFTVASFALENDLPVEITIYDQMGKMVYHDYKNYNKGTHSLTIDDTQLKGLKGVFLLSIETAEVSEVRKMLRLK